LGRTIFLGSVADFPDTRIAATENLRAVELAIAHCEAALKIERRIASSAPSS